VVAASYQRRYSQSAVALPVLAANVDSSITGRLIGSLAATRRAASAPRDRRGERAASGTIRRGIERWYAHAVSARATA
jgi:hypothetical protein